MRKLLLTLAAVLSTVCASAQADYTLSAMPVTINPGEQASVDIYYTSTADLQSLDFTLTLMDELLVVSEGSISLNNCEGTLTLSYNPVNTQVASYSCTGDAANYIKAASTLTKLCTVKISSMPEINLKKYTAEINYSSKVAQFAVIAGKTNEPVAYNGEVTADVISTLAAQMANAQIIDLSANTNVTTAAQAEEISQAMPDKLIYGAGKTTYTRKLANNSWGSICLPYAVTSGDDIVYYTLKEVGAESVTLQKETGLAAGQPGFFKANAGNRTSQGDGKCSVAIAAGTAVGSLTMTGTYTEYNLAAGAGYYISNNALYNDGATVKPYRAFLAGSSSVKAMTILVEDETGIHDVTSEISADLIYNMQGVKLNKAQKGLNIINGKKVLVK